MKIKIGETTYDGKTLDRLTLAEILRLEQETEQFGRAMKWSQLRALADATEGMTAEEFEETDDAPWLIGMIVWVSRLRAGENISFADAIDFPLGDLELIDVDPSADRTGAADPRRARPASGRAARSGARAGAKRPTTRRSTTPSSGA